MKKYLFIILLLSTNTFSQCQEDLNDDGEVNVGGLLSSSV